MRKAPTRLIFYLTLTLFCLGLANSLFGFLRFSIPVARADDYSNLSLEDLQKLLDQKIAEERTVSSDKAKREQDIKDIRALIDKASAEIERRKQQIKDLDNERGQKETDLSQKTTQRDALVVGLYKTGLITPLALFLSDQNFSLLAQNLTYYKAVVLEGQRRVAALGQEVVLVKVNLISNRERKADLEKQVASLSFKKSQLEQRLKELTNQLSNIRGQIAQISARQAQLLAEKTGSFQTSVGEVPAADDPASRLDFNPGFSPAFAAFSFGAPHRKGMSQYGAYGRSKNGQNYQDILKAYYGNVSLEHRDLPGSINTVVGTLSLEDNYLLGIAEMPSSWADSGGYEALKAQAVAARSYALTAGQPICVSESCQVYSSAKAANPPDVWRRAVGETRGQVLVANGQIISAWYASTAGGYTSAYSSGSYNSPGGWDTKCGNQSCWTGDAFEKIASSPWFYKAWYKPRYSSASRSHPWLNQDEFVDIINSLLLFTKDNGTISHLSQTDKANPDTWSRGTVRNQLGGEAIDSVATVFVTYSQGGFTNLVHLETDKGGRDFDGDIFRQIFNLRAPGEIWLASALYNIERK